MPQKRRSDASLKRLYGAHRPALARYRRSDRWPYADQQRSRFLACFVGLALGSCSHPVDRLDATGGLRGRQLDAAPPEDHRLARRSAFGLVELYLPQSGRDQRGLTRQRHALGPGQPPKRLLSAERPKLRPCYAHLGFGDLAALDPFTTRTKAFCLSHLISNHRNDFDTLATRSLPSIRSSARPPSAINIPPNKRGFYLCGKSSPKCDEQRQSKNRTSLTGLISNPFKGLRSCNTENKSGAKSSKVPLCRRLNRK